MSSQSRGYLKQTAGLHRVDSVNECERYDPEARVLNKTQILCSARADEETIQPLLASIPTSASLLTRYLSEDEPVVQESGESAFAFPLNDMLSRTM